MKRANLQLKDFRVILFIVILCLISFGIGYQQGFNKSFEICIYGAQKLANIEIHPAVIMEINVRYGKEIIKRLVD